MDIPNLDRRQRSYDVVQKNITHSMVTMQGQVTTNTLHFIISGVGDLEDTYFK